MKSGRLNCLDNRKKKSRMDGYLMVLGIDKSSHIFHLCYAKFRIAFRFKKKIEMDLILLVAFVVQIPNLHYIIEFNVTQILMQ